MKMSTDQSTSPASSDAMWIREATTGKPRHNSFDFGPTSGRHLGYGRSMSVNSEGASTQDSSPPYSPVDMSSLSSKQQSSKALNIPPSGRIRTSSFSSGYEPEDRDPYLMHSPLSTSAPGMFRRSNSISVGALEYNNNKYGAYDYYSGRKGSTPGANLGPIDEVGKMNSFGDALKKSMGSIFSLPKLPPKGNNGISNGLVSAKDQAGKKKGQMTDRVVSLLCENAIR